MCKMNGEEASKVINKLIEEEIWHLEKRGLIKDAQVLRDVRYLFNRNWKTGVFIANEKRECICR